MNCWFLRSKECSCPLPPPDHHTWFSVLFNASPNHDCRDTSEATILPSSKSINESLCVLNPLVATKACRLSFSGIMLSGKSVVWTCLPTGVICHPFDNRKPVSVGPAYCGFVSSACKQGTKLRIIVARHSRFFISSSICFNS